MKKLVIGAIAEQSFVHQPWRMDAPPAHYPSPIVDHEAAIKHARAEIAKRWQQDGFREESRAVNQKLGSRNRSPTRRQSVKKKDIQQLSFDV